MNRSRRVGAIRRRTPVLASASPRLAYPSTVAAAILVVAGCLPYAAGLRSPFIFDDRGTIIENTTIERLWTPAVLAAPHETPTAGRPVVNLSFAVNYAIGGRDVTGYRVGNLLVHVLCGLMLFAVASRTQPSRGLAVAVALGWTVHPMNSEPVNYVTQRTESLMALFYLLTLYCAVRALEAPRRRGRWEVGAVLACALGMASKESMVTAPLAVLLYDRVFRFSSLREATVRRGRLYFGLASTWAVLAVLVSGAPRHLSAGFTAPDADPWTYLLNQAVIIVRYLTLTVWPRDLVLYYGWPLPLGLLDVLPQAILVLTLLGLTVFAVVRYPALGFLGAWCFLTLAPTSSVMPIATEVGAERRMYLPLMALVALGALVVWRVLRQGRARIAATVAITFLLGLGSFVRTGDYRSSLRLAETSYERWPTPGTASMLGTELAAAGRLTEAERHLRTAAPVHPPAQYYLATVLAAQGRHDEAIEQFTRFIASQPSELDQVHLARALLAEALTRMGRLDQAAAQYEQMLQRSDDREATIQLAQIYVRQQRFEDAIVLFRKALDAGEDSRTFGSLGVALASAGRLDEAIGAFERAVHLDPDNTSARANLARALAVRQGIGARRE